MKSPRDDQPSAGGDAPGDDVAATQLLHAARAFNPVLTTTFADVQAALRMRARLTRAMRPRLLLAGAIALALPVILGGVALSRGWWGRVSPPPPTVVSVSAGGTTHVARQGHFRVSLRGPGALEIPGNDTALLLQHGQILLENESLPVVVESRGHHIDVAPRSTVVVTMQGSDTVAVRGVAGAGPRIDGAPASPGAPVPAPAMAPLSPAPPAPAIADRAPATRPLFRSAPAADRPGKTRIAEEVSDLRDTLEILRTQRDPAEALRRLDSHDRRFPDGMLREEISVTRIEALLALGRSKEALASVEALPASSLGTSPRLRIVRAELRAAAHRCAEALPDFTALLSAPVGDSIRARAERGRADCLASPGGKDAKRL